MKPGAEGPGICSSVFTWRDAADAMTSGQRSAHLSSGNALLPDIFRACGSILRRTLVQRYSIYSETSEHTFPRLSQWRAESADAPPTGLTDTRKPLQMSSSRWIYILISEVTGVYCHEWWDITHTVYPSPWFTDLLRVCDSHRRLCWDLTWFQWSWQMSSVLCEVIYQQYWEAPLVSAVQWDRWQQCNALSQKPISDTLGSFLKFGGFYVPFQTTLHICRQC